jgi:carbon monoxide dehydrogenase subunit G
VNRFSHTVEAEEVLDAPRDEIWAVLSDPDRLPPLVPRLNRIVADGDRWCWVLQGFSALGASIEPRFTEQMQFTPREHIRFRHAPGPRRENAGADGDYHLADVEGGTRVHIRIHVHVDLPLPRAVGGAVRAVMRREVDRMGDGFGDALRREVGATLPA